MVRNLKGGDYVAVLENDTFSINYTWTGPAFDATFCCFKIQLKLTGYKNNQQLPDKVDVVMKIQRSANKLMSTSFLLCSCPLSVEIEVSKFQVRVLRLKVLMSFFYT